MSQAEILADFPDLTHEDLHACLAFAGEREGRLVSHTRVKLLLDESPLAEVYAGMAHVRGFGLNSLPDPPGVGTCCERQLHHRGERRGFPSSQLLHGHPPKVIWIRVGNSSTREIAVLLINDYIGTCRSVCGLQFRMASSKLSNYGPILPIVI
jgi:hypothetical protein